MAALSESPASTDSVLSHPPHPTAIQQRLHELDVDDESVQSFDDVPLVRSEPIALVADSRSWPLQYPTDGLWPTTRSCP